MASNNPHISGSVANIAGTAMEVLAREGHGLTGAENAMLLAVIQNILVVEGSAAQTARQEAIIAALEEIRDRDGATIDRLSSQQYNAAEISDADNGLFVRERFFESESVAYPAGVASVTFNIPAGIFNSPRYGVIVEQTGDPQNTFGYSITGKTPTQVSMTINAGAAVRFRVVCR